MINEYVFVYGTLKKNSGNHGFLTTSQFIGNATTVEKYTMTTNGSFPYVNENIKTSQIHGELYLVTDEKVMKSLDQLEGYRKEDENAFNHYYRKKIQVELEDKTISDTWIYFSINGVRYPVVETGMFIRSRSLFY